MRAATMTLTLGDYQTFLETMPDAAVVADVDGRIVFANAVAGEMFGHDAAALRGQPLTLLLPAAAHQRHRQSLQAFFAQPTQRPMGASHDLRARRADGSELPVDIMLRPLEIGGCALALAVVRDITERRRLEGELRDAAERERRLALTDHLTGAANRRAFVEATAREVERLRRYGHVFGLVYLDLDGFKAVNDRQGHAVGDELLRVVAGSIAASLRGTDLLARLGGDEFALLLPETDSDGAGAAAAKARAEVAAAMSARGWAVTASAGVLACLQPPAHVDQLIRAADTLMYRAKRTGRNRVVSGRFPPLPALPLAHEAR